MGLADKSGILRRTVLCGLLCVVAPLAAMARADSSAAPPKPPTKNLSKAPTKGAATRPLTQGKGKKSARRKSATKQGAKKRGQQVIDPARAREIQSALVRERYMDGEPSGNWDDATQAAMQRYQADQGWQSKSTPDARALIKLGLGPNHDHLLNPESAMTTATPLTSGSKAGAKSATPVPDKPKPQ